ncbi:MAG: thiamine pyrophosphate-dependent enzyme, partial [Desulfatiglandales bacterium]|nr:thiamine pyrophosphate-dependent enzyme [Desulfatiglandales bacterium]
MVRRAMKVSATPPGGPVYIKIPNNMLSKKRVRDKIYPKSRFTIPMDLVPDESLVEKAARILIEAKHPLINVGGEVTRAGANDDLIELAELLSIPVAQGVSCYGDFPFKHQLFAGFWTMGPYGYGLGIDTLLNLGTHMPDPGYVSNPVPPTCRVIHARIEYENIANIYPTDVAIAAGIRETIRGIIEAVKAMLTKSRIDVVRAERLEKIMPGLAAPRKKREEKARARWDASPLSWERLSFEVDKELEEDAVIVPELTHRTPYYWMNFAKGKKRLVGRTTGSALGWGLGASLGVKAGLPDKQVVCLIGDGGLLFGQLESLWSFSRYDVPVIIIILNNHSYEGPRQRMAMISRRSKEDYKDMACYIGDPDVDFVSIANSFGIKGETVSRPSDISPAMKRAVSATR